MTISEKLQQINDIKEGIRDAVNQKGGEISSSTPFSDYMSRILEIPQEVTEGGGSLPWDFGGGGVDNSNDLKIGETSFLYTENTIPYRRYYKYYLKSVSYERYTGPASTQTLKLPVFYTPIFIRCTIMDSNIVFYDNQYLGGVSVSVIGNEDRTGYSITATLSGGTKIIREILWTILYCSRSWRLENEESI